jgi:hypothetical protein
MRALLATILPLVLLMAVGCGAGCVGQQAAIAAIDADWQVIGPRYKAYVEADPKLAARPEIKADWLATADAMSRVIAEAKAAGKAVTP